MKTYHILNGDALSEQFPSEIEGEIIIARECLVDGNVRSDSLEDLFKSRAAFISSSYGDYTSKAYFESTVSEFQKIKNISSPAEINMWFEDDLFCQVNLWFVAHLVRTYCADCKVFLVRPPHHTQYGFGGLSKAELLQAYIDRKLIEKPELLANLWLAYQEDDDDRLHKMATNLESQFPFLTRAVEAHLARSPKKGEMGRPQQTLINIMHDLKTEDFGIIFREFCKREPIYGFGDLQVKRLLKELKDQTR
ncbi:DUF1835 domain-containing protein [Fulvivirga sp. RKSG066]|uniref:DUF1835 domain-containing protein n=1 Tax=Fulvivirga aurantia TaxID=2529383 RepID=UPI0012BD303C|nr:DUF1835 domain-containing protein [Fulvivirga aurantia]MTI22783.1 DUF1835 domain-containing protein [Fulvivirga aurantia]